MSQFEAPNIHDWEITGINILDKDLLVNLRDTDNVFYSLTCSGYQDFYMSDFRPQNVVLDFIEITNKVDSYYHYAKDKLNVDLNEVNFNKEKLILIESSVGCDLICLCSSYILIEDKEEFFSR